MKTNPWKDNRTRSLFTEPIISNKNVFGKEWNTEIAHYYKHAIKTESDREVTLIPCMLVESQVDKLLDEAIPLNKVLFDGYTNYRFKLKLLESLNLMPSQFIDMASIINNIRNEFAHKLSNTTFDDLPNKLFNQLELIHDRYEDSRMHEYDKLKDRKSLYIDVWRLCLSAMHDYRFSIRVFKEESRSENFLKQLISKHK